VFTLKVDDEEREAARKKRGEKPQKPFVLRDHERMRLETKGELAFVSDDDDDSNAVRPPASSRSQSLAFDEEQRRLRASLVRSLHGGRQDDASGDGEGDDDNDDLFAVRKKDSKELEEEDADYHQWLQVCTQSLTHV
jgi:hypothetical protein